MKHTNAIKALKTHICQLVSEALKTKAEIQALKFENGVLNPVTGPKRSALRNAYVLNKRPEIRSALLAYGFLRGIPYKQMEASTLDELPFLARRAHKAIQWAIGDDIELSAQWPLQRVLTLVLEGEDPVKESMEAAQ